MTYQEKALIMDLQRRLADLEGRYAAMTEVFGLLVNRGRGRPTAAEVERLEQLQARMNGAHH